MSGPIQCPSCGSACLEGARFCVKCGSRLDTPAAIAPTAPAQTQQVSKATLVGQPATGSRRTQTGTGAAAAAARAAEESARSAGSMSEAIAHAVRDRLTGGRAPTAKGETKRGRGAAPPMVPAPPPPAQEPPAAEGPPISQMLEDIDDSFDAIFTSPPDKGTAFAEGTGGLPEDSAAVEELFRQIAAAYLGPVRDFMMELELGDPPREWLQVCTPAVTSLGKSAAGMNLADLTGALKELEAALDQAAQAPGTGIETQERDGLKKAYARLIELLPDAFAVDEERDRREPIIVQSLLKQIAEVRKVQLDKIYSAGLNKLSMFYVAAAGDIADATGLPIALSQRIVAQFQQYKRRIASIPPDPGRTGEHDKLASLMARLKQQNSAFDGYSKGWAGDSAKEKKRLRQERSETVLEMNVLLARLGEVGLVERLEKLPFNKKTEELERYFEAQKQKLART